MTTRELLEKFSREEGIALFNERKTDKEVYDLFVSKGLTDSFETFTAEAQKVFSEKVSKMSKEEVLKQIEGAELTDEQLEQIAGGAKSDGAIVGMSVGISTGVVGTGVAIAAIIAETIGLTAAVSSALAF